MTGNLWLDGAILTVSLFNTILLLWLGLTVLLNVERRVLGAWLLGGGLLLGAAFFASHTAILGHIQGVEQPPQSLLAIGQSVDLWWRIGWVPVLASPFGWYGLILWYVGFWDDNVEKQPLARNPGKLRRRHRFWLWGMSVAALLLLGLLLFTHALPSFMQLAQLDPIPTSTSRPNISILAIYPLFMVLCILLSIDALRHPVPSSRLMGDLARARTRPWLMAAAVTLFTISLLVAGFMVWAMGLLRVQPMLYLAPHQIFITAWFDLLIEILIALTILLIGQAIVSYEVFTGRSLPRRGFWRHWRSAILLAAGYALLVGASLVLGLHTIYSLLLTTVLMVAFYALFSWRSFVHRERFMAQLRPFVGNRRQTHRLFEPDETAGLDRRLDEALSGPLLAPADHADLPHQSQAQAIFHAVCVDVLNVARAQLTALGALAPLAGPPLLHPPHAPGRRDAPVDPPHLSSLAPDRLLLPLAADEYGGFQWVVPLWAARGVIGVLLLDNPRDGGLFAQEEIERAQASGERIVDMLAGEELTRRLVALQRRRLAESQVLDHQVRRTLHDQVLPELHAAILQISALGPASPGLQDSLADLTRIHHQVSDLIRVSPASLAPTRRAGAFIDDLLRMVTAEFATEFACVDWYVQAAAPDLEPLVAEVLFFAIREIIRNAAIHGRGDNPARALHLTIHIDCDRCKNAHADLARPPYITLLIEDDGVGPPSSMRVPATSWDATLVDPLLSKQGGLALHSTMLAVVGGALTLSARPEGGAQARITAPLRALHVA